MPTAAPVSSMKAARWLGILCLVSGGAAQSVSFFSNPAFGDPQEDGVMRAALTSAGVSVHSFSSVTSSAGWTNGTVVVPEQEIQSLAGNMPASVVAAIQQHVSSGGRYIVGHAGFAQGPHGCNSDPTVPCNEMTWLNSVFGWTLQPCTTSRGPPWNRNSVFSANTAFSNNGVTSLTDPSNTLGIRVDSLPLGSGAVYSLGDCAVVSALPFGAGQVVTLGFDWFSSEADWNAVLVASLGSPVLPAFTLTPTPAPTLSPANPPGGVSFFGNTQYSDPQEAVNIGNVVVAAGYGVTTFSSLTSIQWIRGTVLVPEQEVRSLALDMQPAVMTAIQQYVASGGRYVVGHAGFSQGIHSCTLNPCAEITWVNVVFNFNLQPCSVGSTGWPRNPAFASGTAFSGGPTVLSNPSNTLGISVASLPAGSRAVYEHAGCAVVAALKFGSGHVVTLGYDWLTTGQPDWNFVLVAAFQSPLLPAITPGPTAAPTTQAPTSQAPTTQAPANQVPGSQAPASQAPTSQAPTSQAPTSQPPSRAPTRQPTRVPTRLPSRAPSTAPTGAPSTRPPTVVGQVSFAPTSRAPTQGPTVAPSELPTLAPVTLSPVNPNPTVTPPSFTPSRAPTRRTGVPTANPNDSTQTPTAAPTRLPTGPVAPTAPTDAPTGLPSAAPTASPNGQQASAQAGSGGGSSDSAIIIVVAVLLLLCCLCAVCMACVRRRDSGKAKPMPPVTNGATTPMFHNTVFAHPRHSPPSLTPQPLNESSTDAATTQPPTTVGVAVAGVGAGATAHAARPAAAGAAGAAKSTPVEAQGEDPQLEMRYQPSVKSQISTTSSDYLKPGAAFDFVASRAAQDRDYAEIPETDHRYSTAGLGDGKSEYAAMSHAPTGKTASAAPEYDQVQPGGGGDGLYSDYYEDVENVHKIGQAPSVRHIPKSRATPPPESTQVPPDYFAQLNRESTYGGVQSIRANRNPMPANEAYAALDPTHKVYEGKGGLELAGDRTSNRYDVIDRQSMAGPARVPAYAAAPPTLEVDSAYAVAAPLTTTAGGTGDASASSGVASAQCRYVSPLGQACKRPAASGKVSSQFCSNHACRCGAAKSSKDPCCHACRKHDSRYVDTSA